jgi:hypothetical protein
MPVRVGKRRRAASVRRDSLLPCTILNGFGHVRETISEAPGCMAYVYEFLRMDSYPNERGRSDRGERWRLGVV